MPHDTTLISTMSVALALAFVGGMVAVRLRLPAIVGYLLAGVAVGPFTPGFVADTTLAPQLAEIGVILLMFGVGIHFSLRDLLAVRSVAVPGAIGQVVAATALAVGVALWWGWSLESGLVLGLAISVASTVVLLRALLEHDLLDTTPGRIAVGWLIVEDLLTVLALVLLPVLAPSGETAPTPGGSLVTTLAWTFGKVALLVAVMLFVGTRFFPWLLARVARTGSRELFILAVLAVAFGVAFGSAVLFGVSLALGAFLAGLVVGESDLSHQAAEEALPLRDAFAVLFFVSVGMLFDPSFLLQSPGKVLAVVAIVIIGKPLAAFLIVLALRRPARAGLVVAAGLAQIGEFSFILAELGRSLGLLPAEGHSLVLAGALLSITLNPVIFRALGPIEAWLQRRSAATALLAAGAVAEPERPDLHDHAVICGYGRVGRAIADVLADKGVPFMVVDQDRTRVEEVRRRGYPALHGDAANRQQLQQMGLADARLLVITVPDPLMARQIVSVARREHPELPIVARTHSRDELAHLAEQGVDGVLAEHELALAMIRRGLAYLGMPAPAEADARVGDTASGETGLRAPTW